MAKIVMGATDQYWVLATVVKNAIGTCFINLVRNYPLGCCTIPCTHYIILFSLMNGHIILREKKAIAKSTKKCVRNTVIFVNDATLSFTLNVVLYHSPWKQKQKSTTTHWLPFGRGWHSLAIFVAKKIKECPMCNACGFFIHRRCAYSIPSRLKVIRHNHPLNLIHSLELNQSNSQLCQLCFLKVDTNYGLYYCSRCNFAAHLDCATGKGNMEDINLLELKEEESTESKAMLENVDSKLDQFIDSKICKVIKTTMGEDRTEIATEIKHFSHKYDLKLTNEVPNNKICNRCIQAILSPSFYNCVKCNFFFHKSCTKLPKIKQHPLHQHPLTLTYKENGTSCNACWQSCSGFLYSCKRCNFDLNVQCSLILNTLSHACHEHPL